MASTLHAPPEHRGEAQPGHPCRALGSRLPPPTARNPGCSSFGLIFASRLRSSDWNTPSTSFVLRTGSSSAVGAACGASVAANSDVAQIRMMNGFMNASLAKRDGENRGSAVVSSRYLRCCWLSATPPRISAPAIAMLGVSGSPSTIQAQTTPNNGVRYVTVDARGAPTR